jgi:hexosaminidase
MPGHSTAAIAAYPELGSSPTPPTSPTNMWGVSSNIYNLNDSTFTFLQNVLTEVMAIFPSQYIHIGGDEAVKDQWKDNAGIQAKMRELGIANEDALQSYFIQRMEKFLNARGRRLVGWDEILQGGLAPNATVMSWHGVEGGQAAAKAGHDSVLSPKFPLYFNYRQSDATDEPPSRAPLCTLREVYDFEPAPADKLTPAERKHIIGVQANLWMEYVRTENRIDHMLFPRGAALAEVGWSPAQRDWQSFSARLVRQFDRYRALGITAAESAFEVRTTENLNSQSHTVQVALSNQIDSSAIRYTLNGTEPTGKSPAYTAPLTLHLPTELRAAAFADGRTITTPIDRKLDELSVRRRDSRELQLCASTSSDIQMEDDAPINGPRAVFLVNYANPCWIYKAADLDSIVAIQASVGQIPWNLMVGKTVKITLRPPTVPGGELQVFLNRCAGKPIVSLPLQPALNNNALTMLQAAFPAMSGKHDLCFTFTRDNNDFIWAVNSIQLVPAGTP